MQPDDVCAVCQRHAVGLGVQADREPIRWLCKECADIAEHIRHRRRLIRTSCAPLIRASRRLGNTCKSWERPTLRTWTN